ncbi:hypothetical protein [Paraburkholderia phenoliruptrix]|uniref:hypothetical protein n=1 Tax=Paraburkholderia phenoliruptrix TaxID=252970 RepID=UPI00285C1402|nr:hypothetical protein [Paraburkholderia phenoliruptrix]MDR6388425.1 hypothetical protein [Paraburkholderia phenoliruptrix]WMY07451.1 hypothetical protein P3F88_14415 [Paraburkholderia phenoliruptrix]
MKDRLARAEIVRLDGQVAGLEYGTIWVKTEGSQYGVTKGLLRSFRFQVNGTSVVLYSPESAIPFYRKVELPLANGDDVCLAIASEALDGQHLVYGLRHAADPHVYIAFAAGSLEFQPDRQMYYLPRLPRFWGKSRWRQASRFGIAAAMAFCVFRYLAHGERGEDGLSTYVVMNSIVALALAAYLLTIVYGSLRWRLNLPTPRQRNLLAVLHVLEVSDTGKICAV